MHIASLELMDLAIHIHETVIITNCSCDETQKLSNMLAGGYDTSTQSFQDLLVFFEVKDRCIHTRFSLGRVCKQGTS